MYSRQLIFILSVLILTQCNSKNKSSSKSEHEFSFQKGVNKVEVYLNDDLFTSYLYADSLQKPVLYPIYGPNGNEVTRSYPLAIKAGERVDHMHHIGLWFTYGEVNGIDFWTSNWEKYDGENPRYGQIDHQEVNYTSDHDKAALYYQAQWLDYKGNTVLEEATQYAFQADSSYRIIDRTTIFNAMQDIHFEDSKEGMYAIRVCRELELPEDVPQKLMNEDGKIYVDSTNKYKEANGQYINSEGQSGRDVWGQRAAWVALEGNINGNETGILFIDHPDNIGYPAYWMARWYGLFGVNPLGAKVYSEGKETMGFKMKNGDTQKLKYRIVVYEGDEINRERINGFVKTFHEDY